MGKPGFCRYDGVVVGICSLGFHWLPMTYETSQTAVRLSEQKFGSPDTAASLLTVCSLSPLPF